MPMTFENQAQNIDGSCWANIIQTLNFKDLAALKSSSWYLYEQDALWQSFLNRLHEIDYTISPIANQGQSIKEAFLERSNQIKNRQLAEIEYLYAKYEAHCFEHYPLVKAITPNQNNLSEIAALSAELDQINEAIITEQISKAKKRGYALSLEGITRFPETLIANRTHKDFWNSLERLNCSENILRTLPRNIGKLKLLKRLRCTNNQLIELPVSIGKLNRLKKLACSKNQLSELPGSISKLTLLRKLWCSINKLETLPECLGELQTLKTLICTNNQFTTLHDAFKNKFGNEWYTETMATQGQPLTLDRSP